MNTVANVCIACVAGMNITAVFHPGTPKATAIRGIITVMLCVIAWIVLMYDAAKKEPKY